MEQNAGLQRQEEEELMMKPAAGNTFLQSQEEEELMMKPATGESVQHQEEEEEEELQMKALSGVSGETVQRQIEEEEEEALQMKVAADDTIQRQIEEEEEEELQMKPVTGDAVQSQEEEEEEELLQPGPGSDISSSGRRLSVKQVGQEGVKGAGGPLPHIDRIQPLFGHHDLSEVKSHTGSQAQSASRAIHAQAYTTGDHIAFSKTPDIRLAAHEAAHVIQQRSPLSLENGVGKTGDAYERQADAVADAVSKGQSAESLLGQPKTLNQPVEDLQRKPIQMENGEGDQGSQGYSPSSESYNFGMDFRFRMDPEIQQMALNYMLRRLDPSHIRSTLTEIGPQSAGEGADVLSNMPQPEAPQPIVPRGAGPERPRAGSAGDVGSALSRVPAVDSAITNLRTAATAQLTRDWRRLGTGERVGLVSAGVVIGGGALAGLMSNDEGRNWALGLLDGRVIPVPYVDGLFVEMNTAGSNLMFGLHLDVGRVLPSSWGFGPTTPSAIGAPPTPQPFVPGGDRL